MCENCERYRRALTCALQGLSAVARSHKKKKGRPSPSFAEDKATKTIQQIMRILSGQKTKICANDKVLLVSRKAGTQGGHGVI